MARFGVSPLARQGATAWMRVDGIHAFVVNYRDSITATIDFIEHGRFKGPGKSE